MPRAGEIWLADIPFTSGLASKVRPVLILWVDANDVVVAAVTSVQPRSASDVPLSDWSKAGLRVPSTVAFRGWTAWSNLCFAAGSEWFHNPMLWS
jgi:mRNA-degrading endonuclease toxin of MazEF toxin-antitoxin module